MKSYIASRGLYIINEITVKMEMIFKERGRDMVNGWQSDVEFHGWRGDVGRDQSLVRRVERLDDDSGIGDLRNERGEDHSVQDFDVSGDHGGQGGETWLVLPKRRVFGFFMLVTVWLRYDQLYFLYIRPN